MYGSALRSEPLIPQTVGFRAPLADRRLAVRVNTAASLRGFDWLRAVIDWNVGLRFALRLLGLPLRNVLALVHAIRLHADLAGSLSPTTVLQISGDRSRWRVVARAKGVRFAKAIRNTGDAVVVSGSTSPLEPRSHQISNTSEFIPARNNPDPKRFLARARFARMRTADPAPHKSLELKNDIFIGHTNLKTGLNTPSLVSRSRLVLRTDISLSFKKTSTPGNLGLGWLCHEEILTRPGATRHNMSATSNMIVEV